MGKLNFQSVEDISIGAALLGTGGGGDPYVGKLMALQAIKKYGDVEVIKVEDIPDDALIVPVAMMGAPTVLIEKIAGGNEFKKVFKAMEKYMGKKIYATMPIEAGGVNSMIPIAVAAQMGVPIVDADGMGRAFPELQMVTFHLEGIQSSPMCVVDEKGNLSILDTISNKWSEELARALTMSQGAAVMISIYPMTGKQLKSCAIRDIMTYSEMIGKAIRQASSSEVPAIDMLLEKVNGYEIFKGKITGVARELKNGFNFGEVKLEGLDEYKGQSAEIGFQNENLIAKRNGEVVATTPDLICLVDLENITPITTEALKYGRRVLAIGLKCDERWRTDKGIKTVGPKYFGYDLEYVPIEERLVK